jgi:glycosyltransferase involved in cell wall biosynthesis
LRQLRDESYIYIYIIYLYLGNGIPKYFLRSPYISSTSTSIELFDTSTNVDIKFNEQYLQTSKRSGKWVFHALYERGGLFLEKLYNFIRKRYHYLHVKELHYASYQYDIYNTNINIPRNKRNKLKNDIHFHGSLSKQELYKLLWDSDYFIYPLVLPWGMVHHDTFGTVVLEALACGVIVITWDVACLSDVYQDYIHLVPTKFYNANGSVVINTNTTIHVNNSYYPYSRFGWNKWMLSTDAIDQIAQAILKYEMDPNLKLQKRILGREFAKKYLWEIQGDRYINWFNSIYTKV